MTDATTKSDTTAAATNKTLESKVVDSRLFEKVLGNKYNDYVTLLIKATKQKQKLTDEEFGRFLQYTGILIETGAYKGVPEDRLLVWKKHVREIFGYYF